MAPYRLHPGMFAGAPGLVFAHQWRPVWCPGVFAFCWVFPATHSAPFLAPYAWLFVASGSPQTVPPVLVRPFFGLLDADGARPVHMKIDTNIMDWSYQTWKIWQILFDWGIWLPAIPVVSIGFYFVPFGFHLWGLILFEIITIFFEKLLCFQKKVGTE